MTQGLKQEAIIVSSLDSLSNLLISHGIDVEKFGKGAAKTIEHLFIELKDKECALTIEDGVLTRRVRVAVLRIMFPNGMVLQEVFQEFSEDGRRRVRKLDGSAGEKLKADESPEEAVARLVMEEFPLLLRNEKDAERGETLIEEDKRQKSYPGLRSIYEKYIFTADFPMNGPIPGILVVEKDKFVGYDLVDPWWGM